MQAFFRHFMAKSSGMFIRRCINLCRETKEFGVYPLFLYNEAQLKRLLKGNYMSNEGKRVRAHYVGTFDDGTKFDSSVDRGEPLEFTCMAGQMIQGFDAAVNEMEVGETKKVHIPAAQAYGEYDETLVQTIPVASLPGAEDLPVGETVYLQGPGGMPFAVKVLSLDSENIVFDMNHEMAGKDLNFEITLVEVLD